MEAQKKKKKRYIKNMLINWLNGLTGKRRRTIAIH